MARLVDNPPNPWASSHVEYLEEAPPAALTIYEEDARSIISENESPDIFFRYSVNPYRGCVHACAYCYARPTHQYLGFGAGTDFDRKIVVKRNAPTLLRLELLRPSWKHELLMFSGNTDCYQPVDASYELTRKCLEVCVLLKNPVAITTKSALVRRDIDLFTELCRVASCSVNVSIAFASDSTAAKLDPYASRTSTRIETIRRLSEAGIPTGVLIAPVLPGMNDSDIPEILQRARDAGATYAAMSPLRLPAEVLPVFEQRFGEAFPERLEKVRNGIREMRGGKMNEGTFGHRFEGKGPRWAMISRLFAVSCQKLGLDHGGE